MSALPRSGVLAACRYLPFASYICASALPLKPSTDTSDLSLSEYPVVARVADRTVISSHSTSYS